MFCECGTGSFKHVVDDEDPEDLVGCTGGGSPKDNKERRRKQHGGGKANPYAERGLDRFSVVLSELEARRAKILRRVAGGSDAGLVLVRFVQSRNGDWTPVVVKLPEQPLPSSKKAAATKKKLARLAAAASTTAATLRPPAPPAASPRRPPPDTARPREREGAITSATAKVVATSRTKTNKAVPARKASFSWGRRTRRPWCYDWPSVLVLTLVSLAVFGRAFAICLASIWWYVLPILGGGAGEEDARRAPAGDMRMSMEKTKVVSPPPPPPNAKKGSISGVYQEVVRSPKGKRG